MCAVCADVRYRAGGERVRSVPRQDTECAALSAGIQDAEESRGQRCLQMQGCRMKNKRGFRTVCRISDMEKREVCV